jgi:hypothetical protein
MGFSEKLTLRNFNIPHIIYGGRHQIEALTDTTELNGKAYFLAVAAQGTAIINAAFYQ